VARRELHTPAKLYIDGLPTLAVGDYIVTGTGKTAYWVTGVRPSPSRPARRYLNVLRFPPAEIPEGATVHTLHWYRRPKGKR